MTHIPLRSLDSVEAGAPADEIDITQAMIEAGMHEYGIRWLGLRNADDDIGREMIIAAYRAMSLRRG